MQQIQVQEVLKNYKELEQTNNPEVKNLILDIERGLTQAQLDETERNAINLLFLSEPTEYPVRKEVGRPLGGMTQTNVAQIIIEDAPSGNAANIRLSRVLKRASDKIAAVLGEPYV